MQRTDLITDVKMMLVNEIANMKEEICKRIENGFAELKG